jgi:signal transduction histidine kinase
MFAIAAREAKRLENLTGEFLTYARPSIPQRALISISDIMRHIADVTKMRAVEKSIDVACQFGGEILAEVDSSQVEGALLNLALNALDATPPQGRIELKSRGEGSLLRLDIENSGEMIQDSILARIFEPFFTTKPRGTGLGLAIARSVAIAHGGDLWISSNKDGKVVFTMTLSMRTG